VGIELFDDARLLVSHNFFDFVQLSLQMRRPDMDELADSLRENCFLSDIRDAVI
jgi:hypothetical protein